ncbi:MAG: hypothetical protein ACOY0T_27450 [Myxococcota bacterium]
MSRARFTPWAALLLAPLGAGACSTDFEAQSKVLGLRALALRSEPASGTPGANVKVRLLAADGGTKPNAPSRRLEIVWIGGCHNPPTRQFYACYPLLSLVASASESKLLSTPPSRFPAGIFKTAAFTLDDPGASDFDFTLPFDILTAAPRASADPIHFGVSYAFFALCAGELRTNPTLTDRPPFECIDPNTSEKLGYRDFITGFSTLYTYEGVENHSPTINGVSFKGLDLSALGACTSDADCKASVDAAGDLDATCGPALTCIPRVRACKKGDCPTYLIEPHVERDSAEALPEGGSEVVWANFYATSGSFDVDTQLISDRNVGWLGDRGAYFKPTNQPGELVSLWLTLNDQRGGATWRSFQVRVGD